MGAATKLPFISELGNTVQMSTGFCVAFILFLMQ